MRRLVLVLETALVWGINGVRTRGQSSRGVSVFLAALLALAGGTQADSLVVDGVTNFAGSSAASYDSIYVGETMPSTINIQDSASLTCGSGNFYIGDADNAAENGTVNVLGGTLTCNGSNLWIGWWRRGVMNIAGGIANLNTTVIVYNEELSVSGGTLNVTNFETRVGWDGGSLLAISGGAANLYSINMNHPASRFSLTGGTLSLGAGGIYGNANSTISLDGGIIRASDNWSSSLPMNLVGDGGNVTFDPNGFNITLAAGLSSTGGLTVAATGGTGAVILSATNTYAGATTVSSGTLRLTHPTALATNTRVYLATGGTLDLAFSGVNQVAALYVDGSNQPSGFYGSHSVAMITGGGFLQVGTGPAAPNASFTASQTHGYEPLTVTFTDTSTGDITNRHWIFGDTNTLETSGTSVTNTYNAGTYTVQLIVSGNSGSATNTQEGLISVAAVPLPAFEAGQEFSVDPASGHASFTIATTNGVKYRIAYRGDLLTTGWTALAPPLPDGWTNGTDAPVTLQDTNTAGVTQRFYRIESKSLDAP